MSSSALIMERAEVTPPVHLRPLVARYSGYRYEGLPPGTHHGLPSPYLTVVLSLGKPTRTAVMPDPRQAPDDFAALAGGLHTRAALIEHDGDQYGVQLALTPEGARSLFGMPAGELAGAVVPLDGLLPTRAGELIERLAGAPAWAARFAILDEVLSRHALRWPGGGGVMLGSASREDSSIAGLPPGTGSVYVVTDDVDALFKRACAAGATVVQEPREESYGAGFTVRDPEGVFWSFGTYKGAGG